MKVIDRNLNNSKITIVRTFCSIFILLLPLIVCAQQPAKLYTENQNIFSIAGGYGIGIDVDKPDARLHIMDKSIDKTALRLDMKQHTIPNAGGNSLGMSLFAIKANRVDESGTKIETVFTVDRSGKISSGFPAALNSDQVSIHGPLTVYQSSNYSVGLSASSNAKPELTWRALQNRNFRFRNLNTNTTVMTLTQNGRVGINTDNFNGNHRLYVAGSTYISENTEEMHSLYVEGSSIAEEISVKPKQEWADASSGNAITLRLSEDSSNYLPELAWSSSNSQNLTFKNTNTEKTPLTISPDGKVGINTSFFVNNHSLYIEGSSVAEEMYVKLKDDWPDYVFSDHYELMPLNELGEFINKNGRLPKMPLASEVQDEGIATGETIRLLTEKVEELTLYLLEQQKEINALKIEMNK